MKKIYLMMLVAATSLTIVSCQKDTDEPGNGGGGEINVPETQSSFMIDFTATWCGPCGGSGLPLFKKVTEDEGSKVIGIAMHTSNSDLTPYWLRNDTAYIKPLFTQIFGSAGIATGPNGEYGIPAFSINGVETTRSESAFKSAIQAKAAQKPVANVGFNVKSTGNGFTVDTKTKFFQDAAGEYYIAIFVIEDKIVHRQNVNTAYVNQFEHMHVLRDVVGGTNDNAKVWGDAAISTGAKTAGSTVTNSYSYTFPTHTLPAKYTTINKYVWAPAKTKIAVTLWKKEGSKYVFVNGGESSYLN